MCIKIQVIKSITALKFKTLKILTYISQFTYYRVASHFFKVFLISYRFLKVHFFGSIFSLKLSLRLKTMLNSIK